MLSTAALLRHVVLSSRPRVVPFCTTAAATCWATVTILYCESCGYERHARRLAEALKGAQQAGVSETQGVRHRVADVCADPSADSGVSIVTDGSGRAGAFEVSFCARGAAAQPIWSKLGLGEPSTPEAFRALNTLLVGELRALRRQGDAAQQAAAAPRRPVGK